MVPVVLTHGLPILPHFDSQARLRVCSQPEVAGIAGFNLVVAQQVVEGIGAWVPFPLQFKSQQQCVAVWAAVTFMGLSPIYGVFASRRPQQSHAIHAQAVIVFERQRGKQERLLLVWKDCCSHRHPDIAGALRAEGVGFPPRSDLLRRHL